MITLLVGALLKPLTHERYNNAFKESAVKTIDMEHYNSPFYINAIVRKINK
jgi:hypothetical protein